mgnify:CR=1 FL=1
MDKRLLKNLDISILFAAIALIVFGCFAIYSASETRSGFGLVAKQLLWAAIGLGLGALAASIDQQFYIRNAKRFYFWMMVSLLAVLFLGDSAKGAQRWVEFGFVRLQPSEFAKVIMIVTMGAFLAKRSDEIRTLKTFVHSFLYLLPPMILIFIQPDLGTSLVLIAIWLTMNFVAGTNIKNLLIFASIGLILISIAWFTPGILKPYQKQRVITLINPSSDPLKSGYHVTQSRIAIGSGQITGKGYMSGTQRKLAFIPEQHTDFIFTVVAEELGFVGAASLILLYLLLISRAIVTATVAEDFIGRAIAAGVAGMFLFHIFVNLGMTLGIMPVTGVPLPLFSYGGSSLMTNLVAIGLLEGVAMRRHRINF